MSQISGRAASARENARQADGKFGSYTLTDAGTDADLGPVAATPDAAEIADLIDRWKAARELEEDHDEEFSLAYEMADQLKAFEGLDSDTDDALAAWGKVIDGEDDEVDEFAVAQDIADALRKHTQPAGPVADNPFEAEDDMRTCYRCGAPVEGGTWCDDCSQEDIDGPLKPLKAQRPDPAPVAEQTTLEVPEGVLPIDVSGCEVNRHTPAAGEETTEHISDTDTTFITCPACQDTWANGRRGDCPVCFDADGLPAEYYANAAFLSEKMPYEDYGLQVAPARRTERRFTEDGDPRFLNDDESIGQEFRVQTRYATNHPRVPYLTRTVTSYIAAIGPDGNGGSTNYSRAQIEAMRAKGVDLDEGDVDVADLAFENVTTVTYSVFNSVHGARYRDETSLIGDIDTDEDEDQIHEPALGYEQAERRLTARIDDFGKDTDVCTWMDEHEYALMDL